MTRRTRLATVVSVMVAGVGVAAFVNHYDMLQPWLTALDVQILEARETLGRWPNDLEEIRANAKTQTRQLETIESVRFVSTDDVACRYVVRGRNFLGFPFTKERHLSLGIHGK